MRIRQATPADMARVAAIYGHHVRTGTASFELEPPDTATMVARYAALVAGGHPWLVAEAGTDLLGYAYAGPYRPRPAYRFTLEDSVYVAPAAMGRGVGSALLGALIEAATATGARQMLAVIADPPGQAGSVALHRRFGFREVGLLPAVGWKADAWRDTLLMQRALGPGSDWPAT